MSAPRFIALEGIDGSGTTSQRHALTAALRQRGHEVVDTCEPSGGEVGRLARALLRVSGAAPVDPAALALLFAADRLHHLAVEIRPALAAGRVVVCDRFVVSSWAYQSLDCPLAWVKAINSRADWPDLTFVLELDAELALARVDARRRATAVPEERYDVPDAQRRLAAAYAAIADDPTLAGVHRVDAAAPIEAVTAAILSVCVAAGL